MEQAPGNQTHGPDSNREIESLAEALNQLGASRDAALATTLTRFFAAVAIEASKTPRFADSLIRALRGPAPDAGPSERPKRANRRTPAPFDPFAVYGETLEHGLRDRLAALSLEQLRDMVAEHGMDNDRLAMKWKDPQRVIDRIVDRVATRAAKGSAFR